MTPTELTADLLRAMALPQPQPGSKDERGSVLVVAGSVDVPGAALLAGNAALRAGAGKLQLATVRSAAMQLALAVPEAMVVSLAETDEGGMAPAAAAETLKPKAAHVDAVLIGSGMVEGSAATELTVSLCRDAVFSYVLDAAALHDLRDHADVIRACGGRAVITPHAGEMAQLLDWSRDAVEEDSFRAAKAACDLLSCVVVMKGAETTILSPAGRSWQFKGGGVGLATSGSGDVLAGIIAGLLARGAEPATAALWGVFLHGEAGRRLSEREGPLGFLARDLAAEVPILMRDIEKVPVHRGVDD
jgi:ADP-dependent NAD(P)H-hydrate dehydratase